MNKRYLGVICLLYLGIFSYFILFDKLKYFLAPNMQIYIKLSIIPLLIIGIVLLFNDKVNYKFKISDLVLILPLILLVFVGNGKLTSTFARNRVTNQNISNMTKRPVKNKKIKKVSKEEIDEEKQSSYDFSNPYFDIVDENYDELSNYITYEPKAIKFKGKTIKFRGFALKKASFLPNGYFAVGKYSISCCAADAGFTGFIIKNGKKKIAADNWYEVEGVLEKGKDKHGYDIMYVKIINIKEINSNDEEQYIYPCYSYGDGNCDAILKYNLEY